MKRSGQGSQMTQISPDNLLSDYRAIVGGSNSVLKKTFKAIP